MAGTYFDYFAPSQAKPASAPPQTPAPRAAGPMPPPIPPPVAFSQPPAQAPQPPPQAQTQGQQQGQQYPPGGPPPGPPPSPPNQPQGGFDPNWFVQNVDSRIPAEQWQRWYNDGLYDPGSKKWRSSKKDKNGAPIPGLFDKPDDCPGGMQAFGIDQCRPEAEVAEITARQNNQKAAMQAPAAPAAAPQQFDIQTFISQILPLLLGFGGGGQARGSFLPGTDRQLNSNLPYSPYF